MFLGYVALAATLRAAHITRNASTKVPTDASAAPGYRIYGPSGLMASGTGTLSALDSGAITGATNASPIVITSTNHKLSTGQRVTISGVGGNSAANGDFSITVLTANTFSLDGSTGNGAYTTGGTWHASGVYALSVSPTAGLGYAAGQSYTVVVTYTVASVQQVDQYQFGVV